MKRRGVMIEKFGVDEGTDQDALEKAAAEGCPKCGARCSRQGNLLICPNCGTEPFERQSAKTESK